MNKNQMLGQAAWALAALLAGCSSTPAGNDLDQQTADVIQRSFRAQGIVSMAVFDTDETNRVCSAAAASGKPLDEDTARRIEAENFRSIRYPADGHWLGDWRRGEKVAQSGRGLTFTDDAKAPNGGNCYNCHEIDTWEISFGTIGPSLYHYGKLRGVTDPQSSDARAIVQYTWGKIWNAKATNACSNMPRAGHEGILTPAQIADVMALLLDPASPVNQ